MSEDHPKAGAGAPKTLSASYRRPIVAAIIWLVILMLWCAMVLDTGESLQAFLGALGVYAALVALTILRRPATPSRLDLLLVGWGLPILFFLLLFLFPMVWHVRGIG